MDETDLARSLERSRRPAPARELYLRQLAAGGDRAELGNRVGVVSERLGDWQTAAAAYRLAVRSQPDWAECWFRLGRSLLRADRDEEAVEALGMALEGDGRAAALLAEAYTRLGDLDGLRGVLKHHAEDVDEKERRTLSEALRVAALLPQVGDRLDLDGQVGTVRSIGALLRPGDYTVLGRRVEVEVAGGVRWLFEKVFRSDQGEAAAREALVNRWLHERGVRGIPSLRGEHHVGGHATLRFDWAGPTTGWTPEAPVSASRGEQAALSFLVQLQERCSERAGPAESLATPAGTDFSTRYRVGLDTAVRSGDGRALLSLLSERVRHRTALSPDLHDRYVDLVEEVQTHLPRLLERLPAFAHLDYKPENLLWADRGLAVVDWQMADHFVDGMDLARLAVRPRTSWEDGRFLVRRYALERDRPDDLAPLEAAFGFWFATEAMFTTPTWATGDGSTPTMAAMQTARRITRPWER